MTAFQLLNCGLIGLWFWFVIWTGFIFFSSKQARGFVNCTNTDRYGQFTLTDICGAINRVIIIVGGMMVFYSPTSPSLTYLPVLLWLCEYVFHSNIDSRLLDAFKSIITTLQCRFCCVWIMKVVNFLSRDPGTLTTPDPLLGGSEYSWTTLICTNDQLWLNRASHRPTRLILPAMFGPLAMGRSVA